MKYLYQFENVEKVLTKEPEIQTIDGKEVEVLVPKESNVIHKYAIKKPSKNLRDEAELFYSVQKSNFIRSGVLTVPELRKRVSNDDGILSNSDKDTLKKSWESYTSALKEYKDLLMVDKDKRSEKDSARMVELEKSIEVDQKIIDGYQTSEILIYEDTAEAKARNKTIFWWTLQLAYEIKDEKPIALFSDDNYDGKVAKYEEYEESENKYIIDLTMKFNQLIAMWYVDKARTKEDFDAVVEFYAKDARK